MATARSQEGICSLVKDGTLVLRTEADRIPYYNGVVVIEDTLVVIDHIACTIQLYSHRGGKLLNASHKLESVPFGVCLISKTEVSVCLSESKIVIMSFKSIDDLKLSKTLDVRTGFRECHSVAKLNSSDKLVVSGRKYGRILCWGIVSITDGSVDSTHNICKGGISHLAIKDNTVYISCWTNDSTANGVYAYDIFNPHTQKFLYQHQELERPGSIMVERGSIFVSAMYSNRIHQLTENGQLATIHTVSTKLNDIFYDNQNGVLYTTSRRSAVITVYRLEYLHPQGVPIEILNMDHKSIQLFEEALKDGKETVYNIRIMVVGHMGVGKTTLVKRLLGEEVHISERRSTEGIDVYVNCCDVSLRTHEWTRRTIDSEQDYRLQRITRVLNEQKSMKDNVVNTEQSLIPPHREKTLKRLNWNLVDVGDKNTKVLYHHSAQQDIGQDLSSITSQKDIGLDLTSNTSQQDISQDLSSTTSQQNIGQDLSSTTSHQDIGQDFSSNTSQLVIGQEFPSTTSQQVIGQDISFTTSQQVIGQDLSSNSSQQIIGQDLSSNSSHQIIGQDLSSNTSQQDIDQDLSSTAETNTISMLKLLKENVNKLESAGKTSLMTIWDFAGQYAFYTTHQTFLTRRAIYLLVSDVSGHVTDLVADECYFDSEGIMQRKVRELIEVWLNLIHSCAASHDASNPPVILVGTHVDKVSQQLIAVESNLPSTSIHTGTAFSGRPRASTITEAVKFVQSRKVEGIVEVAPVSRMTGAHVHPAEDEQRTCCWWPWKKTITKTAVMSDPSTEEPVGNTVVDADAEKEEICQRYFNEIRSYLKDKPTSFHLIDEDFAIDNTVVDKKLKHLKKKIVEVASQQPYWGEKIPARWLPLEEELMKRKTMGVKVISLEDVEKINKEGAVRIESSEELDLFLRYLHETGTIIYFSIEVLRENIVLDPTWLIDALKSLINAQPDLPDISVDSVFTEKWSDFKGRGILSLELIDAIWTKEKYPELHAHKDHMLLIMEQLNIIAKPRAFSEIGEKVENYFLTPCMLRQESPTEVISPEQDKQLVSTPVLCCVFRGKYLPPPIFHRLIAACATRWPVAKKKDTSDHLIFCGCCVFDLDLFHRLTLYCRNHIVYARITRMLIDEGNNLEVKLCSRVRKFITLNLSKITSYLGQNLQYELRTQYPPSHCASEDDMVCLSPPFEMWFADEGHDPDAPITPEHMNHARLCVALVTLCGNALRKILLTYFPVPYTDIYQAFLANKVKLTSRPGRPLLNLDQCQLVFPDPQGLTTGTVDQFDLSLLYTLIRNVSAVPAPVTGWGNDPQDQPRDSSLGASVERIRSYRNHISGHSPDGKISRLDLEDYWNKFEAVIHDIEAIVGGQAYSHDLEKQRRQVISIYEAC